MYHGGEVIALNGAETQAFLRLVRWAEANGRVERIEAWGSGRIPDPAAHHPLAEVRSGLPGGPRADGTI